MSNWYHKGIVKVMADGDLVSGTVKAMLVTSGYTADPDDEFVADVVPATNELSGTGYSRVTLTSKTVTPDDANDRAVFDADDLQWANINAGTAAAVILYLENTNDADSHLLLYIDQGGFPIVTNGGTVQIIWSGDGIAYL